jgi:SAM-dependent methyltransferase
VSNREHSIVKARARAGYRWWRLWIEPERVKMRSVVRRWIATCAPGSRILEVGAGTSMLKSVIERHVPDVYYISGDVAPTDNSDVIFDATAIPMADAVVDAVLALEVLEHIAVPEAMLAEISRVLKPNGLAIITVPFMFGVHDFRDYHRFTPLGFATLAERCGLSVEQTALRGGTFVSATTLLRTLILNNIVGEPKDWRAQGRQKKVLWLIATAVLTPWAPVSWAAMGLDTIFDRASKSPPGYFFLCRRVRA